MQKVEKRNDTLTRIRGFLMTGFSESLLKIKTGIET
jgi:hypothetical protein